MNDMKELLKMDNGISYTIPDVMLWYPHLFKPVKTNLDKQEKFRCSFILDPDGNDDHAQALDDLDEIIEHLINVNYPKFKEFEFEDKIKKVTIPLVEGDEDNEHTDGKYIIRCTASAGRPPVIVDCADNDILEEHGVIHGGNIGDCRINLYAHSEHKLIMITLNGFRLVEIGEKIGGGREPKEAMFGGEKKKGFEVSGVSRKGRLNSNDVPDKDDEDESSSGRERRRRRR